MLTPDSSRFWPADEYEPGHGQPSFDKQFARDWLKSNEHDWKLPQDIVDKTIDKYFQAYEVISGKLTVRHGEFAVQVTCMADITLMAIVITLDTIPVSNFLTCHDGFTMYDLYSYNNKHNEANGWNNTDGANDNRSWNCGMEGDTKDPEVLKLRYRMIRNACAILMCSRGTPMFFSGDEFGNTKFGNNNSYCQDNEISWIDWSLLEKNKDLFEFFNL